MGAVARSSGSVNRRKLKICKVFDGITYSKTPTSAPLSNAPNPPPSVIPANAGAHGYGGPSDIAPA